MIKMGQVDQRFPHDRSAPAVADGEALRALAPLPLRRRVVHVAAHREQGGADGSGHACRATCNACA